MLMKKGDDTIEALPGQVGLMKDAGWELVDYEKIQAEQAQAKKDQAEKPEKDKVAPKPGVTSGPMAKPTVK